MICSKNVSMECKYPNCLECELPDCIMDSENINAMLKRNKWHQNPELYRQKQREYRQRVKDNLPHCDECTCCVFVEKEKQDGYRRLCVEKMRLIEQKVSNCPHWCQKRELAKAKNKSKKQTDEDVRKNDKLREYSKKLYWQRVESGICTKCGIRKAAIGRNKCNICLEKDAQIHKKLRAEKGDKLNDIQRIQT